MAVHRYKANESAADDDSVEAKAVPTKKAAKPSVKKTAKTGEKVEKKERKPKKLLAPFVAIGRYFKGSWQELRQVRWPNRKQAWAMTLAVILFSLGMGALIFLLDAAFTLLFKNFIF